MQVTLSRADRAVTQKEAFKDTAEGRRQSEVLRRLERDSGRKRSEIVAELPVEHDQYRRYLRGGSPLRWDHVSLFAAAFRVPTAHLSQALGLFDDADLPSLCQRSREAVGPSGIEGGEDGINEMARVLNTLAPDDQDRILRQVAEATASYRTGSDD